RDRRAADRLVEIFLPLGHAADARRQAPRRAEALDRDVGHEAQLLQPRLHLFRDLLRQRRQPRGRQLFDADLQQQLTIHLYAFSALSSMPAHFLANATAIWRTLRM